MFIPRAVCGLLGSCCFWVVALGFVAGLIFVFVAALGLAENRLREAGLPSMDAVTAALALGKKQLSKAVHQTGFSMEAATDACKGVFPAIALPEFAELAWESVQGQAAALLPHAFGPHARHRSPACEASPSSFWGRVKYQVGELLAGTTSTLNFTTASVLETVATGLNTAASVALPLVLTVLALSLGVFAVGLGGRAIVLLLRVALWLLSVLVAIGMAPLRCLTGFLRGLWDSTYFWRVALQLKLAE